MSHKVAALIYICGFLFPHILSPFNRNLLTGSDPGAICITITIIFFYIFIFPRTKNVDSEAEVAEVRSTFIFNYTVV